MQSDVLTTAGVSQEIDEVCNLIKKGAELDIKRWGVNHNSVGQNHASFEGNFNDLQECITTRLSYLKNTAYKE